MVTEMSDYGRKSLFLRELRKNEKKGVLRDNYSKQGTFKRHPRHDQNARLKMCRRFLPPNLAYFLSCTIVFVRVVAPRHRCCCGEL